VARPVDLAILREVMLSCRMPTLITTLHIANLHVMLVLAPPEKAFQLP
jgi:hypothetical protein